MPPDKFGFVPVCVYTANQNCNLEQADFFAPLSRALQHFVSLKHLRCCQVKPHGSLVLVSSTYR
ncbi:hypothetical protein, partial [Providencia stuartii]|uniref:hypothetical protein n=1 Tax=Providencia stuartii TaxID=588 RepID=UPI001C12FFD6